MGGAMGVFIDEATRQASGVWADLNPFAVPQRQGENDNRDRFRKPLYWEGVELTPRDLMALRGIMPPPNL